MVALVKQNPEIKQSFLSFCQKTVNEEKAIRHTLLKEEFDKHIDVIRELVQNVVDTDHVSEVRFLITYLIV